MNRELRALGWVAAGGAAGALGRYALQVAWPGVWTTLAINVAGCFLIGVVMARVAERPLLRAFLGTGVLGGFTTFSAWAVETLRSEPVTGLAYAAATVAGSLLAAWAGGLAGRTR